jgi:hypothetical protein
VKPSPKPQHESEWTEEDLLRAAELDDEKFGPLPDQLSIAEAFACQSQIADELHVSSYKTQELFRRALRKHGLTKLVVGFSDELAAEARKTGTTIEAIWRKLEMPEELREQSEVTSPKAVRSLFTLRGDRRRELDRRRKAQKAHQSKFSDKIARSSEPPKAEDLEQKRRVKPRKRNSGRTKRKS